MEDVFDFIYYIRHRNSINRAISFLSQEEIDFLSNFCQRYSSLSTSVLEKLLKVDYPVLYDKLDFIFDQFIEGGNL